MAALRYLFGKRSPDQAGAIDRQIQTLRSRLKAENYGLRRDKIMLRTQLLNEMIHGPERPK